MASAKKSDAGGNEALLKEAAAALDTISPKDITVIKSMANPPALVKVVMEAICVLMGLKPQRVSDGSGKHFNDYWIPTKKMLSDKNFLKSLKEFDKDHIPPAVMKTIREKYLSNPEFNPDSVKQKSCACAGLCQWVLAVEVYDGMIKEQKS